MKMCKGKLVIFLFVIFSFSCERILLEKDPADTPISNFDILWSDFDKTYSLFEIKNIDWDSVRDVYRPMIHDNMTDVELFDVMAQMLSVLEDGHVNLYTNFGKTFSHDFTKGAPENFPGIEAIRIKYLNNYTHNQTIAYARIGADTGYLFIPSFGQSTEAYKFVDDAIESLGNVRGFIIDVRNNGGGSDINAEIIASRFADKKRLYHYIRWKSGPEHDDFTDYIPSYIEPQGKRTFEGPVIVLTNRRCYSSTETFLLQMRTFENVTFVGDTTGGGSGNPILRELPNQWSYRVPRWIEYKPDKTTFEGIGLFPDVPVWISDTDRQDGVDTILETAIQMLQ